MMPKNDRSLQAKETALLALAQGDPDFPAFLDRYRQALPQVAELPAELVEELMAAVEEDPALRLRRREHELYMTAAMAERECAVAGEVTVPAGQLEALFAMTPYYWKTPRDGAARLAALPELTTDISFRFLVFEKK